MTYYDPMYKYSTLTLTNQALQNMLDTNKQYNEFIEKKKEESLNEIKKKKAEQITELEFKLITIEQKIKENILIYFQDSQISTKTNISVQIYLQAKIDNMKLKYEWKKIKKQIDNI